MAFRKHKDLRLEDDTYSRVLSTLQNSLFLEKKGLANDLPFFICPYDPAHEVRAQILGIMFAKEMGKKGITTLSINLYDILISVLKTDGYLDMLLEREGTIERDEFLETIQNF